MSSIEPKDNQVFDFFFHPERTQGKTKVLSFITNIALSLVFNILYIIPFTIIHLKSRTKETPVNPDKTVQVAKDHFPQTKSPQNSAFAPDCNRSSEASDSECKNFVDLPSLENIEEFFQANEQTFQGRIVLAKMLLSEIEQAFIAQNTLVSSSIDTPSYFSQQLSIIKNELKGLVPDANPETFRKELDAILQIFITLSFSNEDEQDYRFSTTFEQRCFIVSRLISECAAENLKETLQAFLLNKLKDITTTVPVPGDGNCFLWACAASQKLSTMNFSRKELINFKVRQNCREDQSQMRNQMLAEFDKLIISGSKEEVESFMNYIAYNDAFDSIRKGISNEALLGQIQEGKPCQQIIEGYKKKLDTKGFWNGDFEVNLLARALKKPIIVFFENQNHQQSTVFGGCQFYPQSSPLLVKFSHHHYEALVPYVK